MAPHTVALALSLGILTGCSGPVAPSRIVDGRLQPALDRLYALPDLGPWARGISFDSITLEPINPRYHAQSAHGRIEVHPHTLDLGTDAVAAILAHELAHVNGARHQCDGWKDRPGNAYSAWAVHVRALQLMGYPHEADDIRRDWFCEVI